MSEMPTKAFEEKLTEPVVMPSTLMLVAAVGEPSKVDTINLRMWGGANAPQRGLSGSGTLDRPTQLCQKNRVRMNADSNRIRTHE